MANPAAPQQPERQDPSRTPGGDPDDLNPFGPDAPNIRPDDPQVSPEPEAPPPTPPPIPLEDDQVAPDET